MSVSAEPRLRRSGFTLVELTIVLFILGLLMLSGPEHADDLAVVYSHDDEHSLYRDFIAALESRWNVEDEGELTDLIRAKRPLRASLLSLTVLGVPQGTKGELGAAFWHELPKMSGFRPRGQSTWTVQWTSAGDHHLSW